MKIKQDIGQMLRKLCEYKGVEIIENDVKIYTESETAVADGRLLILTPIGVSRPSQLLEVQTAEEENEAGE